VRLAGWRGVRKSEGVALHRERSESPRCAVSLVAGVGALGRAATQPGPPHLSSREEKSRDGGRKGGGARGKGEGNPSLRWHQAVNMLTLVEV
jgi:hypothetical protein